MRYELPPARDQEIWDVWLSMHNLPAVAVADELGIFQLDGSAAVGKDVMRQMDLRQTGLPHFIASTARPATRRPA